MVQEAEFPSSVMYACFKQFGGISNKDLAAIVFAEEFKYGGSPLVERLADRTFVTRNVVHVEPGTYGEYAFGSFPQLADKVCALLLKKYPGREGHEHVAAFFAGDAREAMCRSLQAHGLNAVLYRNITSRINQMELSSTADKAGLLVLQFLATGCLGDPARATEITMDRSRQIVNSSFRTSAAYEGGGAVVAEDDSASVLLGLCKIVNGKLAMPMHALSTDPAGTEIGALATARSAINDVDEAVSRRHLRVFRDQAGQWFAEGLGSTNGSVVIRGDSKKPCVIEPPRAERTAEGTYPPVRIYPSDILCLADTTRFMVIEIAG